MRITQPLFIVLISCVVSLNGGRTVVGADVYPDLDKWLISARRAGLSKFTLLLNPNYKHTHLFVATKEGKPAWEKNAETGIYELTSTGPVQFFFYRQYRYYVSGGYYPRHHWSETSSPNGCRLTYSPKDSKVVVFDLKKKALSKESVDRRFRYLFFSKVTSSDFAPKLGDEKSWPMPKTHDPEPGETTKEALDNLLVNSRLHGLTNYFVIGGKTKKAVAVIALEQDSPPSVEQDDIGLSTIKIGAKALAVFAVKSYTVGSKSLPDTKPPVLQSISYANDNVVARYQTEKKKQVTLLLTRKDYRFLVFGKPTVTKVKPVLGEYKSWQLPYSLD